MLFSQLCSHATTLTIHSCLLHEKVFVHREHKDIALVSMANVLHRAKQSLDAAILMHAALETSSELDVAYFALGDIYAVSLYLNN